MKKVVRHVDDYLIEIAEAAAAAEFEIERPERELRPQVPGRSQGTAELVSAECEAEPELEAHGPYALRQSAQGRLLAEPDPLDGGHRLEALARAEEALPPRRLGLRGFGRQVRLHVERRHAAA
jgi:hypothetical protein